MELQHAVAAIISFSLFFFVLGYIIGDIAGGRKGRELAGIWGRASDEWSKQSDRWKEMYYELKRYHEKSVTELNKLLEERGFIKENQDPG
jgi:hypothetical protein